MKGYIYLFRRTGDNSPCYIGKHNGFDIDYFTNSTLLKKRLLKNGECWFNSYYKREIIHEDVKSLKDLNRLEIKYIKEYNTFRGENIRGYNITRGGDGGDTFTGNPNKENARKNYSKAAKLRHKKGTSNSLMLCPANWNLG